MALTSPSRRWTSRSSRLPEPAPRRPVVVSGLEVTARLMPEVKDMMGLPSGNRQPPPSSSCGTRRIGDSPRTIRLRVKMARFSGDEGGPKRVVGLAGQAHRPGGGVGGHVRPDGGEFGPRIGVEDGTTDRSDLDRHVDAHPSLEVSSEVTRHGSPQGSPATCPGSSLGPESSGREPLQGLACRAEGRSRSSGRCEVWLPITRSEGCLSRAGLCWRAIIGWR